MAQLVLVFITLWVYSEPTILWKGQVIDQATGQVLVAVHIRSANDQAVSDELGQFQLRLEGLTQVTLSHIGYETRVVFIDPENLPEVIELMPLELELDGVEVRAMPNEADFKQMVLETPYEPTTLEQNLKNNLNFMRAIQPLVITQTMDSYGQFLQRVIPNGEGGSMFFNSRGGGIIKAIKDMGNKRLPTLTNTSTPRYQISPTGIKRLSVPDSLKTFRTYFD